MAADVYSIWVSMGLMVFFCVFGQLMIEARPVKCPWEKEEASSPAEGNFEVQSRHQWKDFRPAWGAEDLHHAAH